MHVNLLLIFSEALDFSFYFGGLFLKKKYCISAVFPYLVEIYLSYQFSLLPTITLSLIFGEDSILEILSIFFFTPEHPYLSTELLWGNQDVFLRKRNPKLNKVHF